MKDDRRYVSLSEIVEKIISENNNSKKYVWYDMPRTVGEDHIITEDAEFEIIQPKLLK